MSSKVMLAVEFLAYLSGENNDDPLHIWIAVKMDDNFFDIASFAKLISDEKAKKKNKKVERVEGGQFYKNISLFKENEIHVFESP